MTAPNRNALWAEILIEELATAGLESVCLTPGSRSTPLTVAAHDHDDLRTFSHLDERSSAFFALGRARYTGEPVGLVCTSGTAAANFHPAVLEADEGRVPLVLLTADRPAELRDSGANQTTDQTKLYGGAVRWYRELADPEPDDRKLRRLRVDAARAVGAATGTPPGPVHLNVPFRKPLEPVEVPGDVPEDLAGLGADGRPDGFVSLESGRVEPPADAVDGIASAMVEHEPVLLVAGPSDPPPADGSSLAALARATGAPLLADPLSGARFGHAPPARRGDSPVADLPLVCGGYDAYLDTDAVEAWPEPEVVVRTGASPTSKSLRRYLAGTAARQVLIDPAGDWREAEFVASDLVAAAPGPTALALADAVRERGIDPDAAGRADYRERFVDAEAAHWSIVEDLREAGSEGKEAGVSTSGSGRGEPAPFEGAVVPAVLDALPDGGTLFASNSTPVRDLDRFGAPREAPLVALGNRGVSGIDGITSTVLGAASASDGPLVAIVGDLAYYHDANGLLAAARCGVDATIVLVNNDGGGIFHRLPIESFDPPFTAAFKTPHGLSFDATAELYDLSFQGAADVPALAAACERAVGREGLDVIEVRSDAGESQRRREGLVRALDAALE